MALRVKTGTIEPIFVFVTDRAGVPLPGLSDLFVRVRRSDGLWLDWSDLVFKSSGWTLRDKPLTEADASLAPGLYGVLGGLDTTGHEDADCVLWPLQSPGDDAVLPSPEELKIGQWVDAIGTLEGAQSAQLIDLWRRMHLDPANPRVDTPTSIKVPADGSLIDIGITTVGTTLTGQRT